MNCPATFLLALAIAGCGGTATNTQGAGGASGSGGSAGSAGSAGTGGSSVSCSLSSDCPGALVCNGGRCRAECERSTDCPTGQRCVISGDPDASTPKAAVCQLQAEAACHFNSDCKVPLVCAADQQCRNQCAADRDCLRGQVCAQGVCAAPSEVDPARNLVGVDAGEPAPSPPGPLKCVSNSECPGGLVCSFGLCHAECATSKDCPANQRCVKGASGNICQLPIEAVCHFNTDCADPLVCAADLTCRNQCNGDRDCVTGQICAQGVCASPIELDPSGRLIGARDGG